MVRNLTRTESPPDHLDEAVERLGRLPVLSATVRRVKAIAETEDAGIGEMVAALEADQGLAADLLRYANSAACARPLRARSIRAAVTLVGRRAIAQLALEAATGVLNRRHWLATIRRAVEQREVGSVLICDIDHFKSVNDGHGHATGDMVLTEVARHLATAGIVGRLGGDEFAVWVPGAPHRGDDAASAVLQSVASTFEREREGLEVNVSIGAASLAVETDTLSAVLSRADEALYEAKRAGRGRAVRY